ncbi:MAG: DUF499 domain-containing protein [Thermoproteota archaeon]
MGIKSLVEKGVIELWEDVYDSRLDDKAAPDLSDILRGEEEPVYSDPEEFFKRTYMTRSLEELLEETAETLKSGKGGTIFLLTSLFGGGKTHTQICLYHAFTNPGKLRIISEKLSSRIAEAGKPLIVVMDGSRASSVPHPNEPYRAGGFMVKTIWGMLAYRLGAYAKVKHLDDEKAPVPDVDLLKTILVETKEPKLILMDEIVHYVFNMYKSELREYGEKVLLFLDYLARAVEGTPNTVLVASVQAEYRIVEGAKTLLEEEVFKGYAGKVLSVLSRESTRTVIPVTPDDVVKVLQKRIFKRIPEKEASTARDRLHSAYRGNPELFGVEADWQFSPGETGMVATARDTYPFHPKYIEVLQEFVTRNKDLQKTRDAVRITRKVVRRFLRERGDAEFIMPWHIDLRDNDIRSRVLTESRREFRDVSNRDIVTEEGKLGSVVECTKPMLAMRIATSILLKTYTYETFKEPLKVFPDQKTVALMTYEPETFSNEGLQPSDIQSTLEEMLGRLPHFTSENQRYWFTPFPSVIEYVEKRAVEIRQESTLKLYELLKERVKGLLVTKERKKGSPEEGEVFSKRNAIVIGYGEETWKDEVKADKQLMRLVVLVKPEVDEEEVRKIILMSGEGGRRVFRNTLAVVCPKQETDFDSLLMYASKIKAANEVMGSLSEYYTDKEIRDLQQSKLKQYIQDNERILDQQLLTTLTRIAYPVKGKTGDEIKWTDTTATSSIILQVEAGLRDSSTGPKLRTDFDFTDLTDFLKQNENWDMVEGMDSKELREIIDVFYSVTSAPFTTRSTIEKAILEGLYSLNIGVEMDGTLYWKKIGPENGVEIPPTPLKDAAEILPYIVAAEKLREKLIAESGEKRVEKEIHVTEYEVKIAEGKTMKLTDLVSQRGWQKILKNSLILEKTRIIERGFLLQINPGTLVVKPGEEIETTITVSPVEEYSSQVELSVEKGRVEPSRGRPPFKASWKISGLEIGNYNFTITASGEDGASSSRVLTVIVESLETEIDVNKLDSTYVGAKLLRMVPSDMLSLRMSLDFVSKLNLKAEAYIDLMLGGNIRFTGNKIDPKLAWLFIQKFDDILRSLPSLEKESKFNFSIEFTEPPTLDDVKIRMLTPLSEKALFRLRVKKHE